MTARLRRGLASGVAIGLLALLASACAAIGKAPLQASVASARPAPHDSSRSGPQGAGAAPDAAAQPVATGPTLASVALAPKPYEATPDTPLPEAAQAPAVALERSGSEPAGESGAAGATPTAPTEQALASAVAAPRAASAPAKATGALALTLPRLAAPAPQARAPEPSLDVPTLKLRLRETNGIGVFDKLALKRELDQLMELFRGHHENGQASGLALLRNPYNALVQKVFAALREGDPDLARLIQTSREAIWAILADPVKFLAAR